MFGTPFKEMFKIKYLIDFMYDVKIWFLIIVTISIRLFKMTFINTLKLIPLIDKYFYIYFRCYIAYAKSKNTSKISKLNEIK